jgi:hypothetical protein
LLFQKDGANKNIILAWDGIQFIKLISIYKSANHPPLEGGSKSLTLSDDSGRGYFPYQIFTPHPIGLHFIRPLGLPLKGGVIWEFVILIQDEEFL